MTLYLSLDGVDDFLQLPSLTITDIYIDVAITETGTGKTFYSVKNGNDKPEVTWNTNKFSITSGAGSLNHLTTSQTGATDPATGIVLTSAKMTVHMWNTTAWTSTFSNFGKTGWTNANYMKMNIYDIKVYNGASLIAWYDMTTGTVQDQSGNGKHATLTGGTWVDDGGGGTNATINAVTADSNVNTIAPVVTTQQQVSVSSIIADTIADMFAPTISTEISTSIDVLIASSTADVLSPNVGSFTNISVDVTIVNATADVISPSVEAVLNIGIEATVANVTAEALAPFVGSSESIQITAVISSLTADVIAPSVYTSQGSQIDSVIAESTADVISPSIQTDAIITAIISELQAAGIADSLRVIIGDLAQYNEVIQIMLNITRSRTAPLGITQHKQSELNL